MRCYAFHVEPPGEPWVMAEGPDETWMRDLPHHVWSMAVVLSEAEAELDPDFAPALAAWRVRDDSTYEAWCSVEDAEMALDDARAELIVEGTVEFASPLAFKPWQPSARSARCRCGVDSPTISRTPPSGTSIRGWSECPRVIALRGGRCVWPAGHG